MMEFKIEKKVHSYWGWPFFSYILLYTKSEKYNDEKNKTS